ncbi:MAG: DUF362 domain-containing protein [Eubacteriales bacterium]|nr:DUF362 domain-containing protein [Eubacteriales bacterium]
MNAKEIRVIYGNQPKKMIKTLLRDLNIEKTLDKDARIGIKPNLVLARNSDSGATTSPQMVSAVVEYLQSAGFRNICILEGSWVGDRTSEAFKVCGYEDISRQYNVPLYDLQKDGYKSYDVNGVKINVCDKVMDMDFLINMPVLKGHCQTRITCALKNLKGCIPNTEKRKFHTMGLHKPIAYLNRIIKNGLIIVDGLMGDPDFEEGGNPVQMNRILAGTDPVLIDAYVAALMGYDNDDIPYIGIADSIGVGSGDLNSAVIIELNKDYPGTKIKLSRKTERLSTYVEEREACSACYGGLIHALNRLDEKGALNKLKGKIHIGQGYKGVGTGGIGIGSCTRGCESSLAGCPPKAKDILDFIENEML